MVNVCIVKECNNSSKLTMKKCKMFKIPKDELRRKNWLINCSRQDLLEKSSEHHVVCSDHFKDKMFSNPDKTVLFPNAVPTNFSMIFKEHACSTSCVDNSISDPLLFNNSVAMSTPTKQKDSICISCSLSPSSSYSADCSISSSTQTTQILSLHTAIMKKYKAELQEMKNKYEQLELKMNVLSEVVAMKNQANAIDVTSVELFNRVVEAHLPPNLCMLIKQYVEMGKRKP
ncbi:PREDICTED: uncharacterized protein LOC107165034 [Diuraphis noxia]|uniref:uncharacterized protein LOC107165034 n=1 Tax=Diuraphis noxia TaxID=143948 RepID=UPI000763B3C2|nr:PREDICTED: uncharacterized protein LOC107165034 [Diuraphis noxia]